MGELRWCNNIDKSCMYRDEVGFCTFIPMELENDCEYIYSEEGVEYEED